MNPVKDIALAVQPLLPASDGWEAASVMIGIVVTGAAVLAVAAVVGWVINKIAGKDL